MWSGGLSGNEQVCEVENHVQEDTRHKARGDVEV